MPNKFAQLQEMRKNIERYAGTEVCEYVMTGSENFKDTTGTKKVTAWLQPAMQRLSTKVDEKTGREIMSDCGRACFLANRRGIEKGKGQLRKYPSIGEYIQFELLGKPQRGVRYELKGDKLYQFYTHRSYPKVVRCYCHLIRGTPDEMPISPLYCQCSRGFVQAAWQCILDQPVEVELVESCIMGAQECQFVIDLGSVISANQ